MAQPYYAVIEARALWHRSLSADFIAAMLVNRVVLEVKSHRIDVLDDGHEDTEFEDKDEDEGEDDPPAKRR
jgi:secreted protein with Ig-like and vWFA domain